ncbi:ribosomal protein S18-alanine N-acetyltransferase [Vibrio nigripulchritudo]|uniref:ribosomal protein S18-alanine N-acetyltransferase n=1 Tax=Vibrio nigripulchritudo TaxID=28173 RepID=UPI0003B1905A|nr:ribosomal protein S18-alanine N-acetyltransferase [Vibrio nigripulchritudo]CCN73402.1 putative Ribosomal-protein-alanine N-acetyltransferase [Vibrio nigripulchritudo SFn118]
MNQTIVPLQAEHLDSVWAIEQTAHSHPWKESMIRDLNSRGACHHALLVDGVLVGYFYAQHVVGEVTLLNIAVSPEHQGKGFGRVLLNAFLEQCEAMKAESAWLEVRESNQGAFALYESEGFNEVDRRINYYPTATGKEDAIIMSYLFLSF